MVRQPLDQLAKAIHSRLRHSGAVIGLAAQFAHPTSKESNFRPMKHQLPRYLRPNPYPWLATDREKALISSFAEKGYLIVDVDSDDFGSLADRIIADVDPLYAGNRRVQDAWQTVESVRTLALQPKLMKILELLHGRTPFAFQTLNFPVGTQQLTHSDIIHFHSTPAHFMTGVWVAFEDIDANNGALHYYPGSHRLPLLTLDDLGVSGSEADSRDIYTELYEPAIQRLIDDHRLVKEEAYLKRGQAIIWAANLLHGGSPIKDSTRTRHSQVTHYFFERCRYWTPLLSGPDDQWLRYPLDVSCGKRVTRFGRVAQEEHRLKDSRIPW